MVIIACYSSGDLSEPSIVQDALPSSILRLGSLCAAVTAIIYNRDDVCHWLGLDSLLTDEQLLLHAWATRRVGGLDLIEGEYAATFFDRSAHTLTLIRDPLGHRPLYWTRKEDQYLISTDLKRLKASDTRTWHIDEQAIADYLHQPQGRSDRTFFKGIHMVPPGSLIQLASHNVTETKWWSAQHVVPQRVGAVEDIHDKLKWLLNQAVRQRTEGTQTLATHLSGGLDSSLVTVAAYNHAALKHAFTWSPPESASYPLSKAHDERAVIRTLTRPRGIMLHYGQASPDDYEQLISQPMEFEGTADLVDEFAVLRTAKTKRVDVILSGWGGDEALTSHGLGHLAWLLGQGRFIDWARAMRTQRRAGISMRPLIRYAWLSTITPHLPDRLYAHFPPFKDLYMGGAYPSTAMRRRRKRLSSSAPDIRLVPDADRYSRTLLDFGHIAERITTWANWAAKYGITYRYPLIDRRLLTFILSIPQEIRFGDGRPRYLARCAFRDELPPQLSKHDTVNERFRRNNRLAWWRKLQQDEADDRFCRECPWLDMMALRAAIRQGPCGSEFEDLSRFAKIFVALRVWALYQRWA